MCFHIKQSKKAKEVESKFGAKIKNLQSFKTSEHFNAFSFPETPIITNENKYEIQLVNWGLLPHWAPTDFDKNYTLNARIETLAEKKFF